MTNNFSVKISDFDGPLELLIDLVKNNKRTIFEIDIIELVNQYLAYLDANIHELVIDKASEYLIMATYLIELKSKRVLALQWMNEEHTENFEIERQKFINQILEHRKYSDSLPKLHRKRQVRYNFLSKVGDDIVSTYAPDQSVVEKLPKSINVNKLEKAFASVLEKYNIKKISNSKIESFEISVEDVREELLDILVKNKNVPITLEKLVAKTIIKFGTLQHIVATFSCLLEMVKYEEILLEQTSIDDTLTITFLGENNEQ